MESQQNVDAEVALLRKAIAETYAAHLAKAMKFKVIAALPGMGAVHAEDSAAEYKAYGFDPRTMHVEFKSYERYMRLYKKYLQISFPTDGAFKGYGEFGRGYASFDR